MIAKELAEKRVMVQTQVTSMLAWQAIITQAGMSAPAGYEVQQIGSEILPLQVQIPSALRVKMGSCINLHCSVARRLCTACLICVHAFCHQTRCFSASRGTS